MQTAELNLWLRLVLTPGIGALTAQKLLLKFGLPPNIFNQSRTELTKVVSPAQAQQLSIQPANWQQQINLTQQWLQTSQAHHIVSLADTAYPAKLLQLADPPPLLYVAGRLECLTNMANSLAIVGGRQASHQACADANYFANYFANQGVCIISGLALGVDASAHRGALNSLEPNNSIAVLGTGIDVIYPAQHNSLFQQICQAGCVISEFPLATTPHGHNFPQRNRIISGLADAVLVVEASERSGSLITARLAAEQGRQVLAIPGSIHSPLAKGSNWLIKQGATLVENVTDITQEMDYLWQLAPINPVKPALTPTSTGASNVSSPSSELLKHIDFHPIKVEDLLQITKLTSSQLQAQLLALELAGEIVRLTGNCYQRLKKY